jgi:hypothetical protein
MGGPAYEITYQDVLSEAVTNNYFNLDYVDSGTLHFGFSRFSAGAQWANGQSVKIELFYDADGTGNNLQLIDAIYTASETYQHDFDLGVMYPYNISVSRVLVRRTIFATTPTAVEIYAQWQGTVE